MDAWPASTSMTPRDFIPDTPTHSHSFRENGPAMENWIPEPTAESANVSTVTPVRRRVNLPVFRQKSYVIDVASGRNDEPVET